MGPFTVAELVGASGMHENTVRKFIAACEHRKLIRHKGMVSDRRGRLSVKLRELRQAD